MPLTETDLTAREALRASQESGARYGSRHSAQLTRPAAAGTKFR